VAGVEGDTAYVTNLPSKFGRFGVTSNGAVGMMLKPSRINQGTSRRRNRILDT
jgi:hypothetical protein